MAGIIVFEKQNLEATRATVADLHAVGNVEAFDDVDQNGVPTPGGAYQMLRVDGDSRFAEWAMRRQGYANVVAAFHTSDPMRDSADAISLAMEQLTPRQQQAKAMQDHDRWLEELFAQKRKDAGQ